MKQSSTRLVISLIIGLVSVILPAAGHSAAQGAPPWSRKADESLLAATAGGASAEFLVVLNEQADLSAAVDVRNKTARGRLVYETLTAVATRNQAPLRALLDARGVEYRPYWVHNMIWVRGGRELVQTLAARTDVSHVYANTWQRAQLPLQGEPPAEERNPGDIQWNIALVNAPAVWAKGFTGQGAVIGGQDTGYDWQHPALMRQYRGWNGSAADHNYNWHDAIHQEDPAEGSTNPCGLDAPAPCDDKGHGTHTMGTMVGATDDMRIGMAPGAQWIGCRNMESNWGSPVTYAECYEWFIAPYPIGGDSFTDGDPAKAPHVISNSWSCPEIEGCTTIDILHQVVEAVTAAGIVTVHSAGNSGPSCNSIDTPPALYDASFTVGATTRYDDIATFSSRGPVTADGSGRLKPDIVAPGQNVLSSYPGGQYAYLDGTSMAAPHVAGLVGLLIAADPRLAGDVAQLESIITQSALHLTSDQGCGADSPTSVPNNVYGWGRIDALAAFKLLDVPEFPYRKWLSVILGPEDVISND
ncbi:MAG: S8 family serine peptidase [Candidatus Promineofilum sp.]|nr:S8 family serine peptidase [Promineifilum sp.]